MLRFKIPAEKDAEMISQLAIQTFVESHGASAREIDIEEYTSRNLNVDQILKELEDPKNIFRVAYLNDVPVGFSKIIYNFPNPKINDAPICKLEKIYVLKEYIDKKIGKPLFDINLNLARENNQKGIWLYVWTENRRAVRFYEKQGFNIIADTFFKISETHSNPNYWMYLKF